MTSEERDQHLQVLHAHRAALEAAIAALERTKRTWAKVLVMPAAAQLAAVPDRDRGPRGVA